MNIPTKIVDTSALVCPLTVLEFSPTRGDDRSDDQNDPDTCGADCERPHGRCHFAGLDSCIRLLYVDCTGRGRLLPKLVNEEVAVFPVLRDFLAVGQLAPQDADHEVWPLTCLMAQELGVRASE